MTIFLHEAVFQCLAVNCGECWEEDFTDLVEFPYYDMTGTKACSKCPECKTLNVSGEVISTEDLGFDSMRMAGIAEGRSDEESER